MNIQFNTNNGISGIQGRNNIFFGNGKDRPDNAATRTDPLEQKTETARKKAMKLISDAFKRERKTDAGVDAMRNRFGDLQQEYADLQKEVKTLREKELPEEATDEDRASYRTALEEYGGMAESAKGEMMGIDQSLRTVRIERLKHDPIGDAQKEAESLMEAAREDMIGSIVNDGMEYMEEKQKEREEKAKEAKEKEAENRNIPGSNRQDGATEMRVEDAQEEVSKMLSKLGLIEDEIKGIAVDELK